MADINNIINEYSMKKGTEILPLIPIRDLSLCPGMQVSFDVAREKSLLALEEAIKADNLIILCSQKDAEVEEPTYSDINKVGVLAKVTNLMRLPFQAIKVSVIAMNRIEVVNYLKEEPYFEAEYQLTGSIEEDELEQYTPLVNLVKDSFTKYMLLMGRGESEVNLLTDDITNPNDLVDVVCKNVSIPFDAFQEILCSVDTDERLKITYNSLEDRIEFIELESRVEGSVRNRLDSMQKEVYVKEKIHALQEEIGAVDDADIIEQYKLRLEELPIAANYKEKLNKEIDRLETIHIGSAEAGVIQTYIECILDLPWENEKKENSDLKKAGRLLDKNHFGLEEVKERIIEYLAVVKLSKNLSGPIICLVGPPGVGKTSIGKSIAKASNRDFIRLSVGGTKDEAEIKGHRRTYIGSMPGRIINSIKSCQSKNPLFLIDEIDKIGSDFKGDPASALLEVLDPSQNSTFTDTYLEIPFDLSKVMFVTTANTTNTIPPALLDRMEVINISGYMPKEKLEIAKRHLLPKLIKNHGLKKVSIKLEDEVILQIIESYTLESGVRQLERELSKILRKCAKDVVINKTKTENITKDNLHEYLGKTKYTFNKASDKGFTGKVTGLAWTSFGGDTLRIEALVLPGKGAIQLTGSLGDVMKESAKAAISYIRSIYSYINLPEDFFDKHDVHIHVPEGATPKDGPSAGITMATAILSAIKGYEVKEKTSMTGEITLTGDVLPIGGLKEKLLAAHRAGLTKIFIPKENEKDLMDIPTDLKENFEIIPVEHVKEVYKNLFSKEK